MIPLAPVARAMYARTRTRFRAPHGPSPRPGSLVLNRAAHHGGRSALDLAALRFCRAVAAHMVHRYGISRREAVAPSRAGATALGSTIYPRRHRDGDGAAVRRQ